jgi:ribosomal protein S18 acetylase RimI-like enzyme
LIAARTPDQIDAFRTLAREYAASLPFDLDYQDFEEELATLPGKYAPPAGDLLLATTDVAADVDAPRLHTPDGPRAAVGIIAVRPLADSGYHPADPRPACEMKRMYVRPSQRGRGLGRLLGEASLNVARRAGYRCMKLDTESTFAAAVALYRSLGFVEVERYNDDPIEDTIWMARNL